MSCNIKTIKSCEIFGDTILSRKFNSNIPVLKVEAKIQRSDSIQFQIRELNKINNSFELDLQNLTLLVGNYKITYKLTIEIETKTIEKTILIEELSILKSGCNCSGFENKDFKLSVKSLSQTVADCIDYTNLIEKENQKIQRIKNAYLEGIYTVEEVKEYKKEPEKWPGHVGDISTVLRVCLTGRQNTPDLYEIMQVLGKDTVIKRFSKFAK